MLKKRLIIISALPFVTALLLGSSFVISNKPEKVSAINDTHEHDDWTGVTELPTSAGNYYLTDNITLSETWVAPEGETSLDLNGYVINADGGDYSALTLNSGVTLNLYDSGSTTHYFTKDDSELWTLATDQLTPTNFSVIGGCITGVRSEADNSPGAINCSGNAILNMYGGNIVGNKANKGAGVYNASKFYMHGGNIVGNLAINEGGGIYCTYLGATILSGGTISNNKASHGSGVFQKYEMCFAAGTLITMADGSREPIESLSIGDNVRVFDHNEGEVSSSKLFDVWKYPEQHSNVVNLHFTHNIDLLVVYGHSFFNKEENKYVSVTKDTVSNYVGCEFYNVDSGSWETLIGYDFIDGEVDTYVITSEYHLNCVANGMLSNEDGFYTILTNIFDYGENLTIDKEKKAQDIEKYGLYSFENLNYITEDVYDVLNIQYLNVAFGKGLIKEEVFKAMESYYSGVDPELFCDSNEEPEARSILTKKVKKSIEPVSQPTIGFYVGGSIQIIENINENITLDKSGYISIGSGIVGEANGVPAPTENMSVGITLTDGSGRFTVFGVDDYCDNFFSDDEHFVVRFNNSGTNDDSSDNYLELVPLIGITNNTPKSSKDENNGYIEVAASAVSSEVVEITVVPNSGYELASLKYNDGNQDYDITSTKSFTMPGDEVSVTAIFEEKDEQEIIIVLDEKFIYPNTPHITEKQTYSTSNYYEKLGDGVVTIEYKPKGLDDSEYTTEVPTEYGEYTLRVSVAEGSEYQSGFATKDFIYSPQIITQVGFEGNLQQPVAGAVVPEKTGETSGGMLVSTKYSETLTWYPEITTVDEDGKKIFDCDTTYTATVTLTILDSYADNYVFAGEPTLKGAGSGWVLSEDSTDKTLIYTKEFEPTADHSVNKINGTNATCTVDGFKDAYHCETCGLFYEDAACSELIGDETAYNEWILGDGKISASGHSMTHYPAVAPTCTQDGNVEYWVCSHESGVYYADEQGTSTLPSIVVSKLGHDIIHHDAKAPTCTEVGWEAYDTCSRCDYSTYEEIPALGHEMTHHDAKAPTCTEVGWKAYDTCSRCDYSTYVEIPALGHSLSETAGKLPTCTEDGYMVAYKCSTCEMYFTDPAGEHEIGDETAYNEWILGDGKISASGHSMTHHEAVAPTCTQDGNVEYWECSHESGVYYADEQGTSTLASIVDHKLGHDIVHHDAKAPTCTEVGWEAYDTCSRCGYSTYVEIPALGHSLSEVAEKSATCTEDGYMVAYKCSTCEMYFTDPAGEHKIGDETAYNTWKLNEGKIQARHVVNKASGVDPTKERSGYKEAWKCSECGQYFEDDACTILVGDETAYNAWKSTRGYLPQLPNEGLSGGAIAGICVGSTFFLLLVIYSIGYFFLYRKGKLDEKKVKVIYKILPRGEKNLKENEK